MQLSDLERAAFLFYRFCFEHPDLCPHEFEWRRTLYREDGVVEHYECPICGTKKEVKREMKESESKWIPKT